MIETGIISKVKIQDVISNQLPDFIRDESPDTIDFLKQYYISQEYQGGPSDISDNLEQYLNVNNLTPEVIVDSSTTVGITTIGDQIINVSSTKGFPNHYGLLKINDEIITYTDSTPVSFIGCVRGFSGITSYHSDTSKEDLVFSTSSAAEHEESSKVVNLSSLFLKEFYKKFKSTFLPGLEETDFQSNLDVGTFIGESRSLYQTKGTDESFRILFNVLYGITPKIINLEERLIKPSSADYVRRRVCVAELLEGNPIKLKGQSLLKGLAGQTLFRSDLDININASISDIEPFERRESGVTGITTYFKIGLFVGYDESGDIENDFVIVPNSKSTETVTPQSSVISVDSTIGFPTSGTIISGNNTIKYTNKTINQFLNCSGIDNTINPTDNVRSNITYFGFEDGDLDKKVVLRLTGVLSDFEQLGKVDVQEGEVISVKLIGDKVENPDQDLINPSKSYKEIFCNSWIYNTNSSYFIDDVDFSSSVSTTFDLSSKTDKSSLKKGDFVEIVERDTNKIITTDNPFVEIINDNNVTLKGGQGNIKSGVSYKLRKKLNKANSSETPIEYGNDVIISDIQNVYIENENSYVTSNSLPSFINKGTNTFSDFSKQINAKVKESTLIITDNSQIENSIITFNTNTQFRTGDKIFYSYSNGNSIIGLETGAYFVEKVSDKKIKLYGSPSGISDGKNITLTRDVNDGEHKFILFSHRSSEIGAQKLIKKFPLKQNISNGTNELTPIGQIGMLKNGVEITNYKSDDKIFFGPLTNVSVLNGGEDFDVINLPKITISSGSGSDALVQPVISGKIIDVNIEPQTFDIERIISIGVTGGNGTGCVLEPVIGTRFRKVFFDTRASIKDGQQVSGAGINTTQNDSRITFLTNHNFNTGTSVIYDSNNQRGIGVGVGTSSLVNQSIYYVEFISNNTIKLYETLSDLNSGIGTIHFNGNYTSGQHSFKVGLRNTLLDVNVINGGSNYTNRKLLVNPTGISTSNNIINFVNHGFSDGDLINYSTTIGLGDDIPQTISGLDTSRSYYILKNDENSFRLADGGINGEILTDFQRGKNVSLHSTGTGYQTFSYPDIKIFVNLNPVGSQKNIDANLKVRGSIDQLYLYDAGSGYGSVIPNNHKKPIISLKNGKNGAMTPVISNGKINSVIIDFVGQDYFSTPDLIVTDPTGFGKGAKLLPLINSVGIITDVKIINPGIGYSTSTTINVKSAGKNSLFDSNVRSLTLNKHNEDQANEYQHLEESNNKLKYSVTGYKKTSLNDSGLIGWAYDGNPIYGPLGSSDPESISSTDRLRSSYVKSFNNVIDRPVGFELGYFLEDYKFDSSVGDLDEHNGRFEKTNEFPNGAYVYHATIDDFNLPTFPYFIGNSFRSKSIPFNFENNSQENFDFNSNNLIRNTFPYKVADDHANNDFIIETNEIENQKIEIESVSSGSVTDIEVLFGGSNYKVNEVLNFDNTNTNGDGLISLISKIDGKQISSVNTSIDKFENTVIEWSEDKINLFTPFNHNLKTNDVVKISGLSTDISSLNNTFNIGVTSFTTTTISTITASPPSLTGFTTEIFVTDIPTSISVGSSIEIGTETLKILNIYRSRNILTIQRESNTEIEHPKGSNVTYLTNKFTINKSLPIFDSKVNDKVFFNPSQTVGIGTDDGSENIVLFSFAGKNLTRSIPVKNIIIENHPFTTNQKVKFSTPTGISGENLGISTDNNKTTFSLTNGDTLFVVNKGTDRIGIKTEINSNEIHFITIPSISEELNDLYSFESISDQITGKVERIKTTVTTSESHELQNNDKITLSLDSKLSLGIGNSSYINVLRDDKTGGVLFNPIGFNSTAINVSSNTITLDNHGLKTGDKVKYASNLLPDGLENKNYFVYKIDDSNIKLAETIIDISKNIPTIVGIGSTGGDEQSISLINPEIKSVKSNNLVFNLSDSSLTGYDFKIYFDQNFNNEFVSTGLDGTFSTLTSGTNGSVGAALTIGYGGGLPDKLFYNLKKSGFISTSDKEVKNYSTISFVDSFYNGTYQISNVSDNVFDIFLNDVPEKLTYAPIEVNSFQYITDSKTSKGSINKVRIVTGGSNYKSLPKFTGVQVNSIGKDAVISPKSNLIGNVESVRVINEGFEYSSDKTLKPESLIATTVNIINTNKIESVSVDDGGKNYIEKPNIIIVDTDTGEEINSGLLDPVLLENSIVSVNIDEVPIGLPSKTVTLRTTKNTNGIVITDVLSNNSGIFTCRIATPFPVFPIDPFAPGDKVFIEGIENITDGSGFNSADYKFNLLNVTKYVKDVNAQGEVTIDVSEFTNETGIAKTVVDTFSTIINQSDYPSFTVNQNQSLFNLGESISINGTPSNSSIVRVDVGSLKIQGKKLIKEGDVIIGESSGNKCEISKVIQNNGRFKTDFSILKRLDWNNTIGKLNEDFQVTPDNDYYQNMSYSIQSPIEWNTLKTQVNNLLHSSGMKNFADTEVVSSSIVGLESDSNLNVIVDLIDEKRVDEIKNIDVVKDVNITSDSSRFILFENIRLSDFISCETNDVLKIDDIRNKFSNFQSTFNDFIDIFEFSSLSNSEIFDDILIITKTPSLSASFDKIEISNLLLLSNGKKNILVEKSNLINSGVDLSNSEIDNFVNFSLVDNNLRFSPKINLDSSNDRDYDLKLFTSKFNTKNVGFGTTSIGPISLSSRIQNCANGITTNIISVPINEFESLYATIHIIDDTTKEMNLVESFVSQSDDNSFLSEKYFNTDSNELSLNKIGIVTSNISENNLQLSFENTGLNDVKLKTKIIGFGTIGISDATYRFKSTGQFDGSERTSIYSGLSTTNIGLSTFVSLNSSRFNAVKSVVEVSIGSSKAVHEVLSLHDGTDAYVQQSGSLSVTKDNNENYDPSSGLGTFSASLSGSNFKLTFHPDNIVGITTVTSLNNCFYILTDTINVPENLEYGVIEESHSTELYNSLAGDRVNQTQFTLKTNSTPIFAKVFNPNDTGKFISSTGKFNIDNHFFRENEELIYKASSTFIDIDPESLQFKNGSIIDRLPSTVFAKNVTNNSFFISTTRSGTAVTFTGLGQGNAHEFSMAKSNEKALITIDDVAQYPLIVKDVSHSLDSNIEAGGSVGLTTTIVHLSGISTISSEDVLKIDDEFMKVVNVGFATTGGGPVGSSGTFNTVEVERGFVGTSASTHVDGSTVSILRGSYNISGSDIFFTQPPRGNPRILKNENDLNFATSNFTGRVYLRNDYSTNTIYDDISDKFTGVDSTFTLKVGGANTIGIGTTGGSGILFINGIFQSPSTKFNPGKNFKIIESGSGATGVTSIVFTGITSSNGSIFTSNNINTNELPRGGVPVSIGNTINGLGYAPLIGAKVKALTGAGGSITSIVGTAFSGSDLGIQTAAYDNTTGIITFTTVQEHRFRGGGDFVLIDNMVFDPVFPTDFIRSNEYEVVSIAATNVFGVSIGSSTVSNVYQGSGNLYPFFPNLTFGSGYNGLSPIGVAVTDLGYEHRFISANTNAIQVVSGSQITPTNAIYDPVTGVLQLTVPNHGLTISNQVSIVTGSIFFSCSRDNFKTVHPYPRSSDPVAGINTDVTEIISENIFSINVGVNVGSGAQVSAIAGVGGTAIFTIDAEGSNYKDPQIVVSQPSYSNLSVKGISRLDVGLTTDTGTDLRVNAIVKPVTGIGSTLFEVSDYEVVNRGFGFKKGDVVEAVGLVTSKDMPELIERSRLTIDKIYNDSFALWQFGDFDYIDSIKDLQNGVDKNFSLSLNNQLISVEISENLNENVTLSNIFLVVVNGVIQDPDVSYNIVGGTIISFAEPPNPEDDITILFYKGTAGDDSVVNLKQKIIIEEGDEVQIQKSSSVPKQDKRTVLSLNTSKKLETNVYLGRGINSTENRPLNLIKQKEDKVINKSIISKKRISIEPRITPISKIIGDLNTTDNFIFVDNTNMFNYEEETTPTFSLSIFKKDQFNSISAGATSTISIGGTVSEFTITNSGSGYDTTPIVKLSAPPNIGIGIGTTATATAVVTDGSISGINIVNEGLGYDVPPKVIIESPFDFSNTIENLTTGESGITIEKNEGVITGIATTTSSSKLGIKFTMKRISDDGSFSNDFAANSPISVGTPIYIFDTRVGSGVTSISNSGVDNDVVGIGRSFIDNIYVVESVSNTTSDVGIVTCLIKSDTIIDISSTGNQNSPIGKYSLGKISGFNRSSNPISIGVTGLTVGLITSTGITTFPTLKRTGGEKTFEQSGAIIPEVRGS